MRARLVEVNAGGSRRSRLLTVLGTGALVAMASAACGGAAPATMTGEPTATAVPTYVPTPAPTMAPTPVAATGPADGETPGPITWDVRDAPYRVSDVVSTGSAADRRRDRGVERRVRRCRRGMDIAGWANVGSPRR